jgi:hypothetical protein
MFAGPFSVSRPSPYVIRIQVKLDDEKFQDLQMVLHIILLHIVVQSWVVVSCISLYIILLLDCNINYSP